MNIQSNINQGITTLSLLLSQTPMAEEVRTERRIRTEKRVEEETRPGKVETAAATETAKEEVKTAGEEERHEKEKERVLGEATGLYTAHKGMIRPIEEFVSGTRSTEIRAGETSRRMAAKSARALYEIDPKPEYLEESAVWTTEADTLGRRALEMERTAEAKAKKAAKTKKKTKEVVDALTGGET